jgi:excisionase family DNA binding protein
VSCVAFDEHACDLENSATRSYPPVRKHHKAPLAIDFSDRCLTIDESALHLTVSRGMIYKLVGEGRLRPIKLGTRTLIRGADIEELLRTGARQTG